MKQTRALLTILSSVAVLASVLAASPARAIPDIVFIEEDTTWTQEESPHSLGEGVIVEPGVTLTIEPGVTVVAPAQSFLHLLGSAVLNASGEASREILFTSESGERDWDGIRFLGPGGRFSVGNGRSAFRFVTIEKAERGLHLEDDFPVIESATFDDNSLALFLDNPSRYMTITNSVFTNNDLAISGRTRSSVGIYENDFWNNETNLLPKPEKPYDCGPDDGLWDIHRNDILRGPVNQQYFSNDVRTPSGSGASSYAISATDNWWGTVDEDGIEARTRAPFDCCPGPVVKEIHWRPPSSGPHTAWEPDGEVPEPPPEGEDHGDPGAISAITSPDHGECRDKDDFIRLRGTLRGALEEAPPAVTLALRRKSRTGCRWWSDDRRRLVPDDCDAPVWFRQRVNEGEWSYRFAGALPGGRYLAVSEGIAEPRHLGANKIKFRLTR